MVNYHDAMTLPQALELMSHGRLPEKPPMSAAEAISALLDQDLMQLSGWKLSIECEKRSRSSAKSS